MKGDFRKLRYNLWFYFLLFALLLIALVWVFQAAFLRDSYARRRKKEIGAATEKIAALFAEEDEGEGKALTAADEYLNEFRKTGIDATFVRSASPYEQVYPESLGVPFVDKRQVILARIASELKTSDVSLFTEEVKSGKVLVCGREVRSGGTSYFLVAVSSLESVEGIVRTFQVQLIVISVIVIVAAFFLALYLSGKLSKPIASMTESAKRLAKGDYSVQFRGGGYTEMRELSDALNRAKDELSGTDSLRKDLIANVSHDMKTPLTMIKAYAEMIRDISGGNEAKRKQHAQVVMDEADRLTALVNDYLDLSKLQSGVEELTFREFDLSALIDRVIGRFGGLESAGECKFVCEIDPGIRTRADEQKIEQVVYNLAGNAAAYTGEDRTVRVSLKKAENGGSRLDVRDSGKGIGKDKIDTIWEKYTRSSETHRRPVDGTGLGLSIVKTILAAHNFRFGVVSKKGVGSDFFVEFPPAVPAEGEKEEEHA